MSKLKRIQLNVGLNLKKVHDTQVTSHNFFILSDIRQLTSTIQKAVSKKTEDIPQVLYLIMSKKNKATYGQ